MSESPAGSVSRTAYCEDCHEDSQDTIPDTKQFANVAAKRSKPEIRKKRDEASDSGYSSHPAAAAAAVADPSPPTPKKSSSAHNGLLRMARKMAGSKKTQAKAQQQPAPSPTKFIPRRNVSRAPKSENLRGGHIEGREDAARICLSGRPADASAESKPPSPRAARGSQGPPPIQPTPIPQVQPVRSRPHATHPHLAMRPASYHGGVAPVPSYVHAPPIYPTYYERRPQVPPLVVNTSSLQQTYPPPTMPVPPSATYMPSPLTTSPNRQPNYPFPPTSFNPHYYPPPAHPWAPPDSYRPPPPPPPPMATPQPRRMSMQSTGQVIEYPPVPPGYHKVAQQVDNPPARRLSVHQLEPHLTFSPDEEDYFFQDHEEYYRHLMPPPPVPQRPALRHTATVSSSHVPRRQERYSTDYASRSPRKQSLEESRPPSRPSLPSRSSSKNQTVLTEAQHSPTTVRRSKALRPVSYHGGRELEKEVEAYQAANAGYTKDLTVDTIDQVVRKRSAAKPQTTRTASDAGSRASSSRESSETKKRMSLDRRGSVHKEKDGIFIVSGNQKVRVEGGPISLRPSKDGAGGMQLTFGLRGQSRSRDGRARERVYDAKERRYSVAGRESVAKRDLKDIKEQGESEARRNVQERRRSRSRAVRDEGPGGDGGGALVDDEEANLVERLGKLRTSSGSRRSSKSLAGRRISIPSAPMEGEPF